MIQNLSFDQESELSPLINACNDGDLKLVVDLLDNGADINIKTNSGSTALHIASQLGHLDIVRILIERNANINLLTVDGWTPLHFASQRGYLDVVNFLIESGVDINVAGTRYQRTALHYAADKDMVGVVKTLLKNGAKSDLCDKMGDTPLSIANKKSYKEISKLLTKHTVNHD